MNILIVNENYTRGGLETNLYTQYEAMKDTNKLVYAMGNYQTNLKLGDAPVYEGFHFNKNITINDFYEDINRLVEIIKNEKIDVIHAHPFYSVYQAVFAAKLTNTPIAYTLHGVASVGFPSQINDVILYQALLESEIDKIYCVSEIVASSVNNMIMSKKALLLPNAINTSKFTKHEIANNKNWALISRLCVDKLKEIKQLISIINEIDIEKLCIYGDGECKEELQEYIDRLGLTNKVELMGHSDSLFEELNGKFNGIIGIGRVIIESLCMGYPTMLIGYGKIAGIVDENVFVKIKNNNFINKMLPDITPEELNNQLQEVYAGKVDYEEIRTELTKSLDAKKIYSEYESCLKKLKSESSIDLKRIFKEISEIENKQEAFYNSREVYIILKKYIESQCINMFLKNYFVSFNNYFSIIDTNYNQYKDLQKSIDSVKQEIVDWQASSNDYLDEKLSEIRTKIQEIQDRINIKFLAYNTVQRVKKRKKSQE